MEWAKKKWGIAHITISAYNSRANRKIERPHWDLWQMLYKATGAENVSKWYWFLHAVLWADQVSVRRLTGCSPYFMVTGAHPDSSIAFRCKRSNLVGKATNRGAIRRRINRDVRPRSG